MRNKNAVYRREVICGIFALTEEYVKRGRLNFSDGSGAARRAAQALRRSPRLLSAAQPPK